MLQKNAQLKPFSTYLKHLCPRMGMIISRTKILGQTFVTNFSNFGGFPSNFGGFLSNFGAIFSLKFDHSCDLDCPDLRFGSHFYFILQVVVRRGHDEVMDSQSECHRF